MRIVLTCLSALLCCTLLMGAVEFSAPLMPSRDFYVNDHAGVIDRETRDSMLESAQELYGDTGVQIVVLTVADTDGEPVEAYADSVYRGWEIGGTDGKDGMLILLVTEDFRLWTIVGENLRGFAGYIPEEIAADIKAGDFSKGVSGYFYDSAGKISDNAETFRLQQSERAESSRIASSQAVSPPQRDAVEPGAPSAIEIAEDINTKKNLTLYAAIVIFVLFLGFRTIRIATRQRKQQDILFRNTTPVLTYRRDREEVKYDGEDYPSGFGGPGNRVAIYGEDESKISEDILIKRRNAKHQINGVSHQADSDSGIKE